MRTRIMLCAVCLIVLHAAAPFPSHAQWVEDGTAVCTAADYQFMNVITPDGSGGSFIAWRDFRSGAYVYVQHLDSHGNPLWDPDGIRVSDHLNSESYPSIVPDGTGGMIVAWSAATGTWDIYAQRLDADGGRLWGVDGVVVSASSGTELEPLVCSDLAEGAVIAWLDDRNGNQDIFVQRVDAAGTVLWTVNGVALCLDPAYQAYHDMISDGLGGAIVCWSDYRVDADIYANRVSPDGSPSTPANGIAVSAWTGVQVYQEITPDGAGGAIIAWQDTRGANYDIYAQRIDLNCNSLWLSDGVPVCTAAFVQQEVSITSDGEWGAVITWTDSRGVSDDIYAQRLDPGGNPLWTTDGIPVCSAAGNQILSRIVSDGTGGAIIAWQDDRNYLYYDIFAQRIDGTGQPYWPVNGMPFCTAIQDQSDIMLASDGTGGAIACWLDYRNDPNYKDIYAQRIERNGYWGYPAPNIASVRDVPGDQGGYVSLSWDASYLNIWPENGIGCYEIWRALDEEAAMRMLDLGAEEIADPDDARPSKDVDIIRVDLAAGEPYYWHLISTISTTPYKENYSEIVETLFDSTAVSSEYHYYQVVAFDPNCINYWCSLPDSGYSVDNIAPCPPLCLAGEQSYVPEGLALSWAPNEEIDLDEYRVYRGSVPGFIPGPGNLLTSVCDTMTFDSDWSWESGYCYKVSAIDVHGNESGYSLLCSDTVTGDEPTQLPDVTFLAQNYPNPFNPNTTITYGLKEQGHVSLKIYDAAGRLVATIVDESRPAGSYTADWTGRGTDGRSVSSGVYFYKLRAGEFEETKKMILLR